MSDEIRSQYKTLLELKFIEEKIYRLSQEAQQLPNEIRTIENVLVAERERLGFTKSDQDLLEKNLRRAEMDLKEREEKLKRAQEKMMEVKTNQEYQASLKENEVQKQEKGAYEECVIRMMSELDEKKKSAAQLALEFSNSEETAHQKTAQLEEERKQVIRLMEEQISLRMQAITQLSPEVSALYTRTLKKSGAVPVVVAENGRCGGCHMVIRPQLFNEVLGYKAIHRCTNCGRIIIICEPQTESQ